MNTAEQTELIRTIAERNGVAVRTSDPLLVVQVATATIIEQAAKRMDIAHQEMLSEHLSELEGALARTRDGADASATAFEQRIVAATRDACRTGVGQGASTVLKHVNTSLQHHNRIAHRTATLNIVTAALLLVTAAYVTLR